MLPSDSAPINARIMAVGLCGAFFLGLGTTAVAAVAMHPSEYGPKSVNSYDQSVAEHHDFPSHRVENASSQPIKVSWDHGHQSDVIEPDQSVKRVIVAKEITVTNAATGALITKMTNPSWDQPAVGNESVSFDVFDADTNQVRAVHTVMHKKVRAFVGHTTVETTLNDSLLLRVGKL